MTKLTRVTGIKLSLSILGVFVMCSIGLAEEKQKLTDRKDKESYSLGYQFGQSLKDQGMEINLEVYA